VCDLCCGLCRPRIRHLERDGRVVVGEGSEQDAILLAIGIGALVSGRVGRLLDLAQREGVAFIDSANETVGCPWGSRTSRFRRHPVLALQSAPARPSFSPAAALSLGRRGPLL
jgi:hypothetical protein